MGPILEGQAALDYLTLEDGTNRLSWNVGAKLPFLLHKSQKSADLKKYKFELWQLWVFRLWSFLL